VIFNSLSTSISQKNAREQENLPTQIQKTGKSIVFLRLLSPLLFLSLFKETMPSSTKQSGLASSMMQHSTTIFLLFMSKEKWGSSSNTDMMTFSLSPGQPLFNHVKTFSCGPVHRGTLTCLRRVPQNPYWKTARITMVFWRNTGLTTTALSQSLDTSEGCLMTNNEERKLPSVNIIKSSMRMWVILDDLSQTDNII